MPAREISSQLHVFRTSSDPSDTPLSKIIGDAVSDSASLSRSVELQRGTATIPLSGIDVPFHSTHLRPSVAAYKNYLEERVKVEDINPDKIVSKWIPNVMGKRFELGAAFLDEAASVTGSEVLNYERVAA